MSLKVKILIGAGVVAVVFFFIARRRAQAAQSYGVTAGTPSTLTAITAMQAPTPGVTVGQLPGLATQAAVNYAGSVLPPIIGQGLQAVIPQSTPKPAVAGTTYTGQACPEGSYVDPATGKCGSNRLANILKNPAVQAITGVNYNPAAGYYG